MKAAGKRYITYSSKSDVISIYNIADIHRNNAACALNKCRADIQSIADDPYSYWLGGGDYADYIGYQDRKRFDPSTIAPGLEVKDLGQLGAISTQLVKELFEPIKKKSLGLLYGNHEDSYQIHNEQQNLHGWLCTELGGSHLDMGYSALMDVVFIHTPGSGEPKLYWTDPKVGATRQQFRFFIHHGAGGAATPAGKLNRLIKFMDYFIADIYMIGHVHGQTGTRLTQVSANKPCSVIKDKDRLGIITGTYLRTYTQNITGYGEKRGYRPTKLGAVSVDINPFHRTFTAAI